MRAFASVTPDKISIKIVQPRGRRHQWIQTGHRWIPVKTQGKDWFFRHRFYPKTEYHCKQDDMSWIETVVTNMCDSDLRATVGVLEQTNAIHIPESPFPSSSLSITPIRVDFAVDLSNPKFLSNVVEERIPPTTPKLCAKKRIAMSPAKTE